MRSGSAQHEVKADGSQTDILQGDGVRFDWEMSCDWFGVHIDVFGDSLDDSQTLTCAGRCRDFDRELGERAFWQNKLWKRQRGESVASRACNSISDLRDRTARKVSTANSSV